MGRRLFLVLAAIIPLSYVGLVYAEKKPFERLEMSEDAAVVYIFKRKQFGQLVHGFVVNGQFVGGLLKKRSYIPLYVRPGEVRIALALKGYDARDVKCSWGYRCGEDLVILAEPGSEYFVVDTAGGFGAELIVPEAKEIETLVEKGRRGNQAVYEGFHAAHQAHLFVGLSIEHEAASDRAGVSRSLRKSVGFFETAAVSFQEGRNSLRKTRRWRRFANAMGPIVATAQASVNARSMAQASAIGGGGGTGIGVATYTTQDLSSLTDLLDVYAMLATEMQYYATGIPEVLSCYEQVEARSLDACQTEASMPEGSLQALAL